MERRRAPIALRGARTARRRPADLCAPALQESGKAPADSVAFALPRVSPSFVGVLFARQIIDLECARFLGPLRRLGCRRAAHHRLRRPKGSPPPEPLSRPPFRFACRVQFLFLTRAV